MITVRFSGAISSARQQIFLQAAARWDSLLSTGFNPVSVEGETLSGVLIEASVDPIDGEAGVLGQACPRLLLPQSRLPAKGIMQFDTADVDRLDTDGSLEDVILHEMGHVLGFGTLWDMFGLIRASGTSNPQFTGDAASREYAFLIGEEAPRAVPIANTGGEGTREGHWRELIFGDELLSGFLSGSRRPLSRVSIASFQDMGYEVNLDAADPFELPTFRALAEQGVPEAVRVCDLCRMGRPEPVVLDG